MKRATSLALAIVACASLAHATAVVVLAELPFLDADGVCIDLAKPGGTPLPLQVDTGSPESFATPIAARDLGISVRRSKQTPYRRSTRLGRDVEIMVNTRRGDTAVNPGGEWAVLGGRFLASLVLELDLPGRKVRFLEPDSFAVPERADGPDEQVLPLRLSTNRPIIDIEVGGVRVPAVVSTGALGTLLLPGGYAAEAGLVPDPDAPEELPPMPGAGKLEGMIAPSLRIGRFEEKDVPILVAEHGAQGAGARSEAILGLDLLEGYVLRIDYPRRRLWMSRRSVAAEPVP